MLKSILKKYLLIISVYALLIQGCATKQAKVSQSATIIFKTPVMKFYDKGFVTRYDEYIHLQIFNIGMVVLDLKIYEDEVCKSSFECLNNKEFNLKYLAKDYDDKFLYNLFLKDNIRFKDKTNNIFIKVTKD